MAELSRLGFIIRQPGAGPGGVNIYALKCFTMMQGRSQMTSPPGHIGPPPPVTGDLPPRSQGTARIKALKTSKEEPPKAPRQRGEVKKGTVRPSSNLETALRNCKRSGFEPEFRQLYDVECIPMDLALRQLGFYDGAPGTG